MQGERCEKYGGWQICGSCVTILPKAGNFMTQSSKTSGGVRETAVSASTSLSTFREYRLQAHAAKIEQQKLRYDKFWLGFIILERFLTRLLSEKFGLLPGWTNFLDLPILVAFAVYVAMATRRLPRPKRDNGFAWLVAAFLFNFAISAFFNLERLHPGALILFLIGFLEPLAFMGLAYALMPKQEIVGFLVKILNFVGWIQLPVIAFIDLPRFLATRNPDFISGTFGENPYQLVFFLLSWNAIILSTPGNPKKRTARAIGILLLQGLILAIILLAQFRSIIPFALMTWGLTYLFVNREISAGIVWAVLGTILFLGFFFVANSLFPELKYDDLLELTSRTDEVEQSGKVQSIQNYGQLIMTSPEVLVIGTGPATYASRGFRTFSVAGKGDVANELYREAFNTDYYVTDVAAKYVLPTAGLVAFGAATSAVPWFTYLALPAELGVFGLFVVLMMYFRAMRICWVHRFAGNGLGVLGSWVLLAMALLLQMAFLENWLEVSRLTVPVWVVFGVVLGQLAQETKKPPQGIRDNKELMRRRGASR